jgi:hypothetical protein
MQRDLPHQGADGEVDRDELVQPALVVHLAHVAVIVLVDGLEIAKVVDDTGTGRAQQQPVHPEQADCGGMQEEVDRLVLGNVLLGRETEGVDPEQRIVVG